MRPILKLVPAREDRAVAAPAPQAGEALFELRVDVAHQVEVLSLVHKLSTERGIGVVLVLHDVNIASRFCDEILALHSGKLIARGTPAEIMTPEQLQAIYGVAMGVMPHPDRHHSISFVR